MAVDRNQIYDPYQTEKRVTKITAIAIACAFIFMLLMMSFFIINAGERGVLSRLGKPQDTPYSEGFYLKIPLIDSITRFDVKTQKYESSASAASKDLQIVSTTIAVNYYVMPHMTSTIYKEIGVGYEDKIIQPAIQEVVKASTAKFTAEELITKRSIVRDEIYNTLTERLMSSYIVVQEISITDFDFSKSFNEAIEAKVTAEQLALQAKNKLEQIKYEAEQTITKAQAEAESLRIQSEALKNNPDILQLRAIEKWDGILPKVVGDTIPFIQIELDKV